MSDWKGRFREPLDPHALRFSSSLAVDRRLVNEDIDGSIAHVGMLAARKILTSREARTLVRALRAIRREAADGVPAWLELDGASGRFTAEDVHMAVERRLTALTGPVGGKLHTARSRNDQVSLDTRLYLRGSIDRITELLRAVQRALLGRARAFSDVIMPGYTHLQRAQPVLLPHHLLAYVEMFERDRGRFLDCRARAVLSPLGAAALAGTSFPIDRHRVAKALGLEGIVANSIDAVSDRDALVEFISAAAITMMHASRIAEELVLWSSREWHFAFIGEAFTTGSSIMPQKKNPDMAELIRGKTGRVYGDLMALLTVMKGLPLAYNRDMQEDKEPLFDAADTVSSSLDILARMLDTVTFDAGRFEDELNGDQLLATEVADYLVRKGIPFRQAHGIVGELVALCAGRGISLGELPLGEYRRRSKAFGNDVAELLHARTSLAMKRSAGSTSPAEVAKALKLWGKRLG
ncbi:MAG TPA: argininosuccinate lyase [Bacteroidota bacterium]|nr:argininosuccinate lyase [Bacteroidota bacterium]